MTVGLILDCAGVDGGTAVADLVGTSQDYQDAHTFLRERKVDISIETKSSPGMKQVEAQTALTECFGAKYTDEAQDFLVLYFGHGEALTGDWQFLGGTVTLEFLLRAWSASGRLGNNRLILLMDCCHSGAWIDRILGLRVPLLAAQSACCAIREVDDQRKDTLFHHWLLLQSGKEHGYWTGWYHPMVCVAEELRDFKLDGTQVVWLHSERDPVTTYGGAPVHEVQRLLDDPKMPDRISQLPLSVWLILALVVVCGVTLPLRCHVQPALTSPRYWLSSTVTSALALLQALIPWFQLRDAHGQRLVGVRMALVWWFGASVVNSCFRAQQFEVVLDASVRKGFFVTWQVAGDITTMWSVFAWCCVRLNTSPGYFVPLLFLGRGLMSVVSVVREQDTLIKHSVQAMSGFGTVCVVLVRVGCSRHRKNQLEWAAILSALLCALYDVLIAPMRLLQWFDPPKLQLCAVSVYLLSWSVYDWTWTLLIRRVVEECALNGEHRTHLHVLLVMPVVLCGAFCGTMLFLNLEMSFTALLVLAVVVSSLPVGGLSTVIWCLRMMLRSLIGWHGGVHLRHQMFRRRVMDRSPSKTMESSTPWMLAHARVRIFRWSLVFVLAVVVMDYMLPARYCILYTRKTPRNLAVACAELFVSWCVSWLAMLGLDWYWSHQRLPGTVIGGVTHEQDPFVVVPRIMREHALFMTAVSASTLALPVRWVIMVSEEPLRT